MNKISLSLWGSPQPCKTPGTSELQGDCQIDETSLKNEEFW
jgi:hypothetical protein